MAAAYAALVSLFNIIHQILLQPRTHHFTTPREQIESLQKIVCSLIDFIETYSSTRSKEIQNLEKRITFAAYEAEDIIESQVVEQIKAENEPENTSSFAFRQNVRKAIRKFFPRRGVPEVIKQFVSIHKKVVEVRSRIPMEAVWSTGADLSRSVPTANNIMVGFNEHLTEIKNTLGSNASDRQIVPVVGMGGIGKTTLATAVYSDRSIVDHFDLHAWVTVSPEYAIREILLALLHQVNSNIGRKEEEGRSAEELGELLSKELFGRRYLVVLDDMWDIKTWPKLRFYFPETNNGSRVLVTTRQLNLAEEFRSCSPYQIGLLDEGNSWDLILKKVFANEEECPTELERIGKSIARNCGGLPLALIVIAGLLAKSKRTREFWEYVEENVISAASSGNDEHCTNILSLSYTHLPIHLKPCFLYLAMFPKNLEIRVSRLVKLWVAEGFIKPRSGRSSTLEEEAAEGYLEDLLDRNLIMVSKRGCSGKVKSIGLHDLVRVLCLREARKDKFLCVVNLDNPKMTPHMKSERRLSVHVGTREEKICKFLRSAMCRRSFLSYPYWESERCIARQPNLLRVLDVVDYYPMDKILKLINSRYITCSVSRDLYNVSSFITQLWSLQTLIVPGIVSLPPEIWQMPQLRHLMMARITLPDPSDAQVLENLQTLSTVQDFTLTEQVLRKIPNLKKVGIHCRTTEEVRSFCLSNLVSLHKLESLALAFVGTWTDMAFPVSLKKLTLRYCRIPWEDMSVLGALPKLEVLKLQTDAAIGQNWNPNEDEFRQLKFLMIDSCQLESWEAEASHFPILEQLHLKNLKLEKIPMEFAEISTLQVIDLNHCSSSLFTSAKEMSKERLNLDYEDIQVRSYPSQTSFLRQDNVVGFEDEAETIINYLCEESEELEVISIIGMPGLGKTTLASMIYRDERIQYEVPTLIWVTVSRDFSIKEVFLTIIKKFTQRDMSGFTTPELAQQVKLYLERPKFVLFMDDVWTSEAWDLIEAALPKTNKLGKVLITSRDEKVACQANPRRDPHRLRFLTYDESWLLLLLEVFGKPEFPPELEMLGKHIAKQCCGVPLAIVVIGGILVEKFPAISDVKDEWEKVSNSMSAHLYDKQKLTEVIISLSYNKLPHDLRECFLYLGMFPQDIEIPAWKLIRLWMAEGFIKQKVEKTLEEVAEDNLRDLVARKLVMVDKTKANGEVKTCRVHAMICEFCKSQAAFTKQNLFQEVKKSKQGVFHPPTSELLNSRRLCIHSYVVEFLKKKPKGPRVQSFLCFSKEAIVLPAKYIPSIPDAFDSLWVVDINPIKFTKFPTKLTQLFHLRYIALSGNEFKALPEAVSNLWNLQTIRIDTMSRTFEIKGNLWKMMQLRHLKTKAAIVILNKERGGAGENLQTLSRLSTKCCTEDVFNRALNLKNLGIRGNLSTLLEPKSICLEKLDLLQTLKLVHDVFPRVTSENPLVRLPQPDRFPPNLKILKLSSTFLDWNHMATLGKIHTLEVLKLKDNAFMGHIWESVGGGFHSLEFLCIARTDLVFWTSTGDPFPKLKYLALKNCEKLEEIPYVLEKSLQILDIERVTSSLIASARRIQLQSRERAKGGEIRLIIAPGDR